MKLMKKFIAMLAVAAFILSTTTTTTFASDIDWKNNVIRATGVGMAPQSAWRFNWKSYARRAARLDALRNFAEASYGVTIETSVPITDIILMDTDKIISKVSVGKEIADNARTIAEKEIDGGGYEVTMELPLSVLKNNNILKNNNK